VDRHDLAARDENNDGLWDWNLATNRVHYSPRWVSMLGCEERDLGNTPEDWFKRVHPEDLEQVKRAIDAQFTGASSRFESEHRMLHADGTYRWMSCHGDIVRDGGGKPVRMTGSQTDITARKVTDALTGLPNRLLLQDRLTGSIERARRRDDFLFAVLLLDLDRFKSLVERLGSTAGDQLLIAVARRLETSLRAVDPMPHVGRDHVVARLDEDEFSILLDGLKDIGEAKTAAEFLVKSLSAPFKFDHHEVFVTASIGVALSASGYNHPDEVLRDADIALHRAKSLGKARCEVFDTAVFDSAQAKLQLEEDLQLALGRKELSVVYQPVMSLTSGGIEGFEALVRWKHSERGPVPPLEFIPIAEKTGLIVPLGRWVLHEACRQLKAWRKSHKTRKDLWISVNFSIVQFRQPSIVEQIDEVLRSVGLDPHCLVVELTESVVMENPEAVRSLLMQLRVMGVRIALDDFGAGYSSLGYLRELPVDLIKIDRCFVRRMETGKDAVEIVRTMSDLAHQLGLRVIAEGIENEVELQLVRSTNCEYAQGFLFSKPVDGEKCSALLKAGSRRSRREESKNELPVEGKESSGRSSGPARLPAAEDVSVEIPAAMEGAGRLRRGTNAFLFVMVVFILLWVGGFVSKMKHWSQPSPAVTPESSQPSPQKPPETPLTAAAQQPTAASIADPVPLLQEVSSRTPIVAPKPPGAVIRKGKPAAKPPLKPAPVNTVHEGAAPPQAPVVDTGLSAPAEPPLKPAPDIAAPGEATSPQVPVKDAGSPAIEATARTLSVIHIHALGLGSCRGVLKVSPDDLSFIPEKEKDGFKCTYSECSSSLTKDRLVIKSGSRTFRFKSATARSKEENLSHLRGVAEAISSRVAKPASTPANQH
jgi:diguanylate cyclase (GGDEF)-like protein/PAS domain S-box-containing protein